MKQQVNAKPSISMQLACDAKATELQARRQQQRSCNLNALVGCICIT